MRLIELLIGGFTKIFFPYKVTRRSSKTVAQAVRSDWRKIGKDFRKVIRRA
ncbi:MAG: hypothetical protein IJ774_01970 [Selenomonadaceae bacterium]|nr:hypothetical protein [Selenomonadaceae bacterium]MBR1805132.1 hypothetical protein [Selenomonadaceae bacterium]